MTRFVTLVLQAAVLKYEKIDQLVKERYKISDGMKDRWRKIRDSFEDVVSSSFMLQYFLVALNSFFLVLGEGPQCRCVRAISMMGLSGYMLSSALNHNHLIHWLRPPHNSEVLGTRVAVLRWIPLFVRILVPPPV